MQVVQGKTEWTPKEAGYDEARLDMLHRHFDRMMKENKIIGATYCLARHGKIFAHGAMGRKTYYTENAKPMQPDTVIRIASITKVFTTIAIMQLIEDGFLRLDDKIAQFLPQFQNPPFDQISVFHLITHTSGLCPEDEAFPNDYQKGWWYYINNAIRDAKDGEHVDWIAAALATGMRTPPGVEWQYSTFGFIILGVLIEKITGKFANDYIMEKIVVPLQMKDTAFHITQDMAKRMLIKNEHWEKEIENILNGTQQPHEKSAWDEVPDTGGGLFSTAADLTRLGNMMLQNGTFDGVRILGRKAVEKITTPQITDLIDHCWGSNEPRMYGIGFDMRQGPAWVYSEGIYFHEGAGACDLIIDPKEDFVAAWFIPFAQEWCPEPLFNATNVIWSGLL